MTDSALQHAADFIRNSVATGSRGEPLRGVQLLELLRRRARRKARKRRLTVAGISALLVAGAVTTIHLSRIPRELTYRVGTSAELGTVGGYVTAPTGKPLDLQFSEGSKIVLEPRGRIRIASTTSRGVTMILEEGRARADIVHHRGADWRILAGPYSVGVTGTSFDVNYEVSAQTFELVMRSGAVRVSGPGLGSTVEVRDTQRLVLSASSGRDSRELSDVAAPGGTISGVESSHVVNVDCPSPVGAVPGGKPAVAHDGSFAYKSTPSSLTTESWSRLGARGEHLRIVELAERADLDKAVANASAADLMALGNAARFAGKPSLAFRAYRAVRARFSSSSEANGAAFFLGRLSESSEPSQALEWYERYVDEAPTGVWVADALGRHMVILNTTQRTDSARDAAKQYLERFPSGPYAGFARKILGL